MGNEGSVRAATDAHGERNLRAGRQAFANSPEAAVPEGFLLVELVTSTGETIRGIRLNEDTFSIQVKDSSNGLHSFRKADLIEVRKLRGKSPMLSYERSLAPEELTDLVAYLAGLRGKS